MVTTSAAPLGRPPLFAESDEYESKLSDLYEILNLLSVSQQIDPN
jgi:hypothetical protein